MAGQTSGKALAPAPLKAVPAGLLSADFTLGKSASRDVCVPGLATVSSLAGCSLESPQLSRSSGGPVPASDRHVPSVTACSRLGAQTVVHSEVCRACAMSWSAAARDRPAAACARLP